MLSLVTRFALAIQEGSEWTPVEGGSYREGVLGQPITLNPIISKNQVDLDISRLLYSSLADLTQDYEVKDDGRTYIVKLKENLRWSNGQPLTSDDVIFTIETIQDPDTRSPLKKNWQGVVAERISELRVSFSLPSPYAFMEQNFERLPIIPAHIFGSIPSANLRLSSYNLEPVGSGPYKFHEFTKRKDGFISRYHLKINENYHAQKPFIKDFYFVFYDDLEEMRKDFLARKIDGFGSLTPPEVKELPSSAVVTYISLPSYYAVFFNQNINPHLKDDAFRSALDAGIDRRGLVEEVLKNKAEIINGPLGRWGKVAEVPYNPEEARKKLTSLKQENVELTLIVPEVDFLIKTAFRLKEEWLTIGVAKVNIITLPPAELLENVVRNNNDYEALLFGNVLENPLDLFPFWHSAERFFPGLNLALYKNAKVDTLIERVRQTEDQAEQKELAQTAEAIIVSEKPAIFLYSIPYTYIYTSNLNGFGFKDPQEYIVTPADRFRHINDWHVAKVRVIK